VELQRHDFLPELAHDLGLEGLGRGLELDDHLAVVLALASRSTSHRPSCPKAWRAMPRCRPGTGCPARCRHAVAPLPRTSPRHRHGAVRTAEPAEPVGVARRCSSARSTTFPRPANRTTTRGGRCLIPPCTGAAGVDLPPKRVGTEGRSPARSPEGDLARLGSPVPVGAVRTAEPAEPVGVARRCSSARSTTFLRPANRTTSRGGRWLILPYTGAADVDLPPERVGTEGRSPA
jgi:hypothetical protein